MARQGASGVEPRGEREPGLIGEIGRESRTSVSIRTLPKYVGDAFVAVEDHRFYHHHRVLESEAEAFRLALSEATKSVIARSLDLIGVEAPERM